MTLCYWWKTAGTVVLALAIGFLWAEEPKQPAAKCCQKDANCCKTSSNKASACTKCDKDAACCEKCDKGGACGAKSKTAKDCASCPNCAVGAPCCDEEAEGCPACNHCGACKVVKGKDGIVYVIVHQLVPVMPPPGPMAMPPTYVGEPLPAPRPIWEPTAPQPVPNYLYQPAQPVPPPAPTFAEAPATSKVPPPVVHCSAVEAVHTEPHHCILRAITEDDKTRLEVRTGAETCLSCESMNLKVHGTEPLKVSVSGHQVYLCNPFVKAKADCISLTGQEDHLVLEGHVRLQWNVDEGQHADVTATRIIVNLKDGHVEIKPEAPAAGKPQGKVSRTAQEEMPLAFWLGYFN